ncbi:MAG: T9SS type A sorting domain-containing protein [Bacteroidetes bacterium]|nr:T9SS type A sorting domain-containing protein [Bacteroidota bacterium]
MKRNLLSVLMFSAVLFCNTANAQLSQGGMPYSFSSGNDAKQAIDFVNMPTFDLVALQTEDAINDLSKGPFRFGYNHMVNMGLSNSGTWTSLSNGDRLWQMGLKSIGAQTLNLAFDDFFMPEGAKLFIYNASKSFVIGAFTSINNQEDKQFATDLIPGDAVILEYYEPANVANKGKINLFRVTHGYRGVEEYVRSFAGTEAEKSFGGSGTCEVNVNCALGTNWQNEKRSVVCLVSGGSEFCTGALVNDVPQDGKPYILTANHCGASGFGTWVFRFNWEAPGCSDPVSSPSTAQSLTGGVHRSFSANSDFSLVEITGGLVGGTVPVAYNPYFAGWSNIDVPADSAWGIHHPSGDIKKISQAANACISSTWSGTPANSHWQVGLWTTACTEPGSSGSPLFDQNHRIVGQLHGGPSACGLASSSMNDVYGKFSLSWLGGGTAATQLKAWLDPANTGATVLDGYDPSALPTSINKVDANTMVNVYPNPSNGNINVELKLASSQNVSIKVMNILGETVSIKMLSNSSSGNYNIDLSAQAEGIYFVEVKSATEKSITKIIVIK